MPKLAGRSRRSGVSGTQPKQPFQAQHERAYMASIRSRHQPSLAGALVKNTNKFAEKFARPGNSSGNAPGNSPRNSPSREIRREIRQEIRRKNSAANLRLMTSDSAG